MPLPDTDPTTAGTLRDDAAASALDRPWAGGSLRWKRLQLLAVLAVALVSRLLTIGSHVTNDEALWMERSIRFSDALRAGHWSAASASTKDLATMPGASTMWLGTLGRLTWNVGHELGLVKSRTFMSLSGLATAQAFVALVTSLLIALLVWLVYRWAGWGAGAIAAGLIAADPWLAGLGSVLHTDELTALFGMTGMVCLAVALDVPERCNLRHPIFMAGLGGFLVVESPLTKIVGGPFAIGVLAMFGYVVVRGSHGRRADGVPRALRRKQIAVAIGVALVAVPLSWPAIVADPSTQYRLLLDSAGIGDVGHSTFFMGQSGSASSPLFFLVALPLRMTPWFFLGLLVALPLAFIDRSTRAVWLAIWVAPTALVLSTAEKQFDRYGLVMFVAMALLVAVVLGPHLDRLLARGARARQFAAAFVVLVALHTLLVAPWGLLYFNPLLGGEDVAERTVLIGSGEGFELAIDQIQDLEGGDCAGVSVLGPRQEPYGPPQPAPMFEFDVPCSELPSDLEGATYDVDDATYVVAYVNQVQRLSDDDLEAALDGRTQVGTVVVRGILLATIWR